MALGRLPETTCERCGEKHSITFYSDGSIRSVTHPNCPKPVPGPPNPPRLLDRGKFFMVATTCVECGTKGMRVTQMAGLVHKTIICAACQGK